MNYKEQGLNALDKITDLVSKLYDTIYNRMFFEELFVLFLFGILISDMGYDGLLRSFVGMLIVSIALISAIVRIVKGRFKENLLIYQVYKFSDKKVISVIIMAFMIIFSFEILENMSRFAFTVNAFYSLGCTTLLRLFVEKRALILGLEKLKIHKKSDPIDLNLMDDTTSAYESISKIDEIVQSAVEKQMKGERLKTQLITNVSHDLKTPLTSIINYAELLKKTDLNEKERKEYTNTLYKNAERMKTLINDLVEASKTSTGNVEVNKKHIEFNETVLQSYSLFDDKFEQNNLEFIYNSTKEYITVFTDGEMLSRILENLFSNIYKYSLSNSRVYGKTEILDSEIKLELKNISKDMLNISVDELKQEFVRGDSSRNTEGSGLGLHITENLTKLLGGRLEMEINGDMFITSIFLPYAKHNEEFYQKEILEDIENEKTENIDEETIEWEYRDTDDDEFYIA
ncbi:MAG: HAMP domain-containing sensor histidine kinase [Tissierellia bacterium]|nr:HAMP domain-containing sensor histidine kinase [Tissierellia bacterium]